MFDIASDFQKNMRNTFYAVTYPGVIGIGGVFFAHFTVTQAFLMYMLSTVGGMTTTLLPALRRKEKNEQRDGNKSCRNIVQKPLQSEKKIQPVK